METHNTQPLQRSLTQISWTLGDAIVNKAQARTIMHPHAVSCSSLLITLSYSLSIGQIFLIVHSVPFPAACGFSSSSALFYISLLSFSFSLPKWLERIVLYYCLPLPLMPPQASTASSISGDVDVNLEIKILWSILSQYTKISPKLQPTFYSSQNYLPFFFSVWPLNQSLL